MGFDPLLTPVDYIRLEGKKSPGIARLTGFGIPNKWDQINGYGYSGAFAIYRGRKLSEGTLTIELYDSTDWEEWHLWSPLVLKKPGRRIPRSLDIWHPWLEMLDIKSVVIVEPKQPRELPNGAHAWDIKLLEFRNPKLRLSKPTGSKTAAPTDPVEIEIEKLTNQVQDLL